jgi:hypothetical protein
VPIKAESKAKYPANWASEIRPAIMQRAGFQCEAIGAIHLGVKAKP